MHIIEQITANQGAVVITTEDNKYNLMRKLSEVEQMFQLPIFTLNEVKQILMGEFDQEAIVAIVKYYQGKYGIDLNINVAKKYLQTMEQIDLEQNYSEELLSELQTLKQSLKQQQLFEAKVYRQNLLVNKQIYYYDVVIPELIKQELIQLSNYQLVELKCQELNQVQYYEFNTILEEVEFVCGEIAKLIASGVNPGKIKLHIPQGEYINVIMMNFSLYNIAHDLVNSRSLYSYQFIKDVIQQITIDGINCLNDYAVNNDLEQNLFNQLISIINRYPSIHEEIELLTRFVVNDCKQASYQAQNFDNVVSQVNFETYMPEVDEYLFCFNFAEGRVPKVVQDTAIISDALAVKYNRPTSQEQNSQIKKQMLRKINACSNITLSFARNSINGEEAKSSLVQLLSLIPNELSDDQLRFSQDSDVIALAKADELKSKYDTKHENLKRFKQHQNYSVYQNQVNNELYQELGKQELSLSATSIQKFFECEFKFYLNKILKVNLEISDPTMIEIGNLYHYVLENAQKQQCSDVEAVRTIIKDYLVMERVVNPQLFMKPSQEVYLEKYALYLHEIISVIFDFHKRSEFKLDAASFEAEFSYTLDHELVIKLLGKVDKFVELDLATKFYIVIIDYKTKNKPNINHENFKYGYELQNFIYLNLIKESRGDDEIELVGTYQQRVKPQHLLGHEEFNDDFKLFGYTTSNPNIVKQLEPEFQNKEISQLANAKTKANGEEFDRYAKIYDEESLAEFETLIKEKLAEVVTRIKKSNYQINPKLLKGKNISCDYCDYRDICFRTKTNFIELTEEDDD